MSILFMANFMNQASSSQSLGKGSGLFVMAESVMGAGFSAGAGSYSVASAMPSPMLSCKTDPEKVPPNCGWI